jgi:hypothetical protein
METEFTRADFIERFGDIELAFSSYYKYTFTYTGEGTDPVTGETVKVSIGYGGTADDIYRYEVSVNDRVTVRDLDGYNGYATLPDGTQFTYYDF